MIVKTQKVMSMLLGYKVLFSLFFALEQKQQTEPFSDSNSVRSVFRTSNKTFQVQSQLVTSLCQAHLGEILRGRFRATFGGANTIDDGIQ